jgi:endonuclease III related protein
VNARTLRSEYHVKAPRDASDFFEIAIGAILTQNIAWKNVDTALAGLKSRKVLDPVSLGSIRPGRLAELIRSTGYYNQKTKKIKNFLAWYYSHGSDWRGLARQDPALLRAGLLSVNGIGPETADSILLYALGVKIFVVDAYTKRILSRIGILTGREKYDDIQELFHRECRGTVDEYREYHALIVAHGKDYCKSRNPRCADCCLAPVCSGRACFPGAANNM